MQIKEFTLPNEEKLHRAIYGSLNREGREEGGLLSQLHVEDVKDVPGDAILAEYDKLGGLILKGKYKVKLGSFYDFKNRCPRKKPEVLLVFRVEGENVELPADEPIPLEIQASEIVRERKAKKNVAEAVAKEKKVKKAKKKVLEEDEE